MSAKSHCFVGKLTSICGCPCRENNSSKLKDVDPEWHVLISVSAAKFMTTSSMLMPLQANESYRQARKCVLRGTVPSAPSAAEKAM
eukprot:2829738-Rhodomonas_salina.1